MAINGKTDPFIKLSNIAIQFFSSVGKTVQNNMILSTLL